MKFFIYGFLLICTIFVSCDKKVDPPKADQNDNRRKNESGKKSNNQTEIEGFFADYENTNRVIWQKPDMVMELLGSLEDKVVADIGAGTGYFSLRMARRAKMVWAIDIDMNFLNHIDSIKFLELEELYQPRLKTRLASTNSPNLDPESVDIALLVNTYMYITDRVDWLKKVKESLRDGGQLVIIDFKRRHTPVGPPGSLRVPLYVAEEELIKAGYELSVSNDSALDYQYILVGKN